MFSTSLLLCKGYKQCKLKGGEPFAALTIIKGVVEKPVARACLSRAVGVQYR